MEDERRVSDYVNGGPGPQSGISSYWLDACEGISCDIINEFVDFDASMGSGTLQDNICNQDTCGNNFFGGIDQIFEGFQSGNGVLTPNGGEVLGCNGRESWFVQNEASSISNISIESSNVLSNGVKVEIQQSNEQESGNIYSTIQTYKHFEAVNGVKEPVNGIKLPNGTKVEKMVSSLSGNGFKRHENNRDIGAEGDERYGKRSRVNNSRNERNYMNKTNGNFREKERHFGWKRCRDLDRDENERRNRDHIRRREYYNNGRKESRDRESRGYWERDKLGTNEMVYRSGSWEADRILEGKTSIDKNKDCDVKMEKNYVEIKEKIPKEQARQYQLDVLEQAKKRNTIAFLETGAGKTLIAVLLIKSIHNDLQLQNKKILAVFLVPKVPLVYQQAEVIRESTGFQVGHYCGEMGQDFWDIRRWQREFETKQVLVMTAQILLNILRHSIIKMDAINLLILDECHHAVKKHPYSLLMSEFYHTTPKEKRPSVFGMTASPVNLKGVSNQVDCEIKIRNLETKLDSMVCTIKDRKELEKYVPMPSEVVVEYDKAATLWSLHEQIKHMEKEVKEAGKSRS